MLAEHLIDVLEYGDIAQTLDIEGPLTRSLQSQATQLLDKPEEEFFLGQVFRSESLWQCQDPIFKTRLMALAFGRCKQPA